MLVVSILKDGDSSIFYYNFSTLKSNVFSFLGFSTGYWIYAVELTLIMLSSNSNLDVTILNPLTDSSFSCFLLWDSDLLDDDVDG